jgi:branched-chain amino acid transport system substrate-binding protein
MRLSRISRTAAAVAASIALCANAATGTFSNNEVKIGVLDDMSGAYATVTGPGNVVAAQMAIDEFGGKVLGKPIKLVSADHQLKPDIAASIARQWIDQDHVDMITGLDQSAVGLAVQKIGAEKHTILMNTGSGTTELTESQCMKYGVHYGYDTHGLAAGTGSAIVENGGNTWFFIIADYAFGRSLEKDATKLITAKGGKVLGTVAAPIGTNDFSSFLLQAQASKAKVVGLGNAGTDTINAIKQAHEFHIVPNQQLAAMLLFITDVKAMGLETAKGLLFTTAFYSDRTPETRAWSEKFFAKQKAMPTFVQAATYSAVRTYLKAIEAAGTDNPDSVRAELGKMTINDMFISDGHIAANGQLRNDLYLMKVKSPDQSKGPWDLVDHVATIKANDAYIPLSESKCPLLKQ